MDVFARRYWVMAFAARGGNWDLARYEWRESIKLLHQMAKTRPKYAEDLAAFEGDPFAAIGRALESADLSSVEAAMRAGIDASDTYHEKWTKPYIRFRMPNRPPDFLDVSASE